MTESEFVMMLRDAAAKTTADLEPHQDDLVLTLVGRSMKGIGVRPMLLAEHEDGERVYGFTRKQVQRLLAKHFPG